MTALTKPNHTLIYREAGRFAGWPANYGLWSWGDEIVAGFTVGVLKAGEAFHARDRSQPFVTLQARSLDGGLSWQVGPFPGRMPGGRGLSADEHMEPGLRLDEALHGADAPIDAPGGFDFAHPDFALMCARTGLEAGARSFYYTSFDRCRSWQGPFWLPTFGQTGIAARTDYIVLDSSTALLFLTASKPDGREGRVFCARMSGGGQQVDFVSWIGPELPGDGFGIMPASARLGDGTIVTAIRCHGHDERGSGPGNWIDVYRSADGGLSWLHLSRPVVFRDPAHHGNPAALTLLGDGRLCLIYGSRDAPYSICARLSADSGASWGGEITLRSGGGSHDIGYPRTALRPDGTLVTVYYFNDHPAGERYIAAALWQPEAARASRQ